MTAEVRSKPKNDPNAECANRPFECATRNHIVASARLRHDARIVSREKGRGRLSDHRARCVGQAERGGHGARNAEEQRRNVTVCLAPGREHFAFGLPVEAAGAVQTGFIP